MQKSLSKSTGTKEDGSNNCQDNIVAASDSCCSGADSAVDCTTCEGSSNESPIRGSDIIQELFDEDQRVHDRVGGDILKGSAVPDNMAASDRSNCEYMEDAQQIICHFIAWENVSLVNVRT